MSRRIDTYGNTSGTSAEATSWVSQSNLTKTAKNELATFTRNFPSLAFRKETEAYLDMVERRDGLRIPSWLREIRLVLGYAETPMPARFSAYDHDCARADIVQKVWYKFGLGVMASDDRSVFMEFAKLYPIGSWVENDRSYLAISLEDDSDQKIYECAREDLIDNLADDEPPYGSIDVVFDTYPRMLSRILAFKSPEGDILYAEDR
ncbi:hypothetical protein [Streptomyces buecherae]|uniref:Uncharacterized protein n=1 Tax=Streptomyces buecherae TaxID=2763006 RepID=A0A7H8N357_9ACTN|nr:hypothetical protein [Streptomyces buecherae]QKW48826.1 hypothetical protein HUT08_03905 [Streptomyces buecherae]